MSVKKLTQYVVALVFGLLCAFCVPKDVMATATSGSCGTGSTWSYDNGTLTISGSGAVDNNPWITSYKTSITSVVIQEGITSINQLETFANCANLKQVSLPDSLTDIGWFTFKNCTALESITIPKNVVKCGSGGNTFSGSGLKTVTIADGATMIPCQIFMDCKELQTVNISKTVTTIEGFAFENCTSLKQISLPDSLTDMGWYTFKGCTALESITIPKNVVMCGGGGHCFENSGLKAVTFADGAIIVPLGIFSGCTTLQTVHIPQSMKKIDSYAFESCTGLTKLTLSWYLESIGSYAFRDCTNLKEITIYQKVAKIDNLAFQNVTGLKIYGKAKSTAQIFAKKNGYSFATCKIPALKGITYTQGNLKYKVVTDDINGKGTVMVTGIKKNAFSVTIPKTVKLESYKYKIVKINNKAFYKKSKITKVTIQSTYITSIGRDAFKEINKKAIFTVPKSKFISYKQLLTSKTGFAKKTMKVKK